MHFVDNARILWMAFKGWWTLEYCWTSDLLDLTLVWTVALYPLRDFELTCSFSLTLFYRDGWEGDWWSSHLLKDKPLRVIWWLQIWLRCRALEFDHNVLMDRKWRCNKSIAWIITSFITAKLSVPRSALRDAYFHWKLWAKQKSISSVLFRKSGWNVWQKFMNSTHWQYFSRSVYIVMWSATDNNWLSDNNCIRSVTLHFKKI